MLTQFRILFLVGLFAFGGSLASATAADEKEGQADLDKAIETKVSAETMAELGTVIDLCQSALDKGLDKANEEFCKQLLLSTLLQRGETICDKLIGAPSELGPQWPNYWRAAVKDADRAIEVDPKSAAAQVLYGKLQLMPPGDRKKSRQALDEAMKLAKDDNEVKAQAYRWRGQTRDNIEERIGDLSEAVKLDPDNAEIRRERGGAYLGDNKAEEALADLDAAVKLDEDNADGHEFRGMALVELKRYDEAAECFGRAAELSPGEFRPLLQRARVNALAGKNEQTLEDIDRVLDVDPDNLFGLLLRAQTLVQLDKAGDALDDARHALELQPNSDDALRIWAMVTEKAGKSDDAVKELRQQVEANPDDAVAWLQLGLLYAVDKEPKKAIDAYSAAIKLDPKREFTRQVRADMYLNDGRQKEAIADYEESLKLNPNNSGVLNNLAWVLSTSPHKELRDGQRAIKLATKACELTNYKQAHILSTLAAAYGETGDFKTARKWSAQSIEIADDSLKDQLRKELVSYEKEKPWREEKPQQ